MVSFNPLHSASSGLKAHAAAFAASAQNVANVHTEDYRTVEAAMQSDQHGGVNVSFQQGPEPEPGLSGTDLIDESVDQVALKAGYKANAQVFRAADAMIGRLLDIMA